MTKLPQSKNMVRVVAGSLLVAGSCLLTTPSLAGEFGLSDLQNVKVAHHLAKQRMLEAQKSREEREQDDRDRAADEGSDGCGHERQTRPPLLRQRLAVEGRGDGRRSTWGGRLLERPVGRGGGPT